MRRVEKRQERNEAVDKATNETVTKEKWLPLLVVCRRYCNVLSRSSDRKSALSFFSFFGWWWWPGIGVTRTVLFPPVTSNTDISWPCVSLELRRNLLLSSTGRAGRPGRWFPVEIHDRCLRPMTLSSCRLKRWLVAPVFLSRDQTIVRLDVNRFPSIEQKLLDAGRPVGRLLSSSRFE